MKICLHFKILFIKTYLSQFYSFCWKRCPTMFMNISERYEIRRCIQKFPDWVITKYMLTTINSHWETTQRVKTAKLTRLTHKIAVQLHLVAESCTICSSHSRWLVWKLFLWTLRSINSMTSLSKTFATSFPRSRNHTGFYMAVAPCILFFHWAPSVQPPWSMLVYFATRSMGNSFFS
jgi:hypothetical protein